MCLYVCLSIENLESVLLFKSVNIWILSIAL